MKVKITKVQYSGVVGQKETYEEIKKEFQKANEKKRQQKEDLNVSQKKGNQSREKDLKKNVVAIC